MPLLPNLNMLINSDITPTQLFNVFILLQHKTWKPFTADEVPLWFKQGLIGELIFFSFYSLTAMQASSELPGLAIWTKSWNT